ncbi:HAD-superfamily class IIA hydrolase, TIGR01459 [Filomicrobium insigne]|uniref:HAD-superfamily class IIA hydrolase, TIGR01459 n=1 Tax=Filomicrobium insigne TaxID=418854 RepID=A0A1H0LRU0_9HYPH|nr:TIGR01459 family HAD-type hydrolase [Filomicrobium insigne]SDO70897.1 HAD-superfamily class IIA hydrolase, TIGR01459 [Filomicrobium insigne]
MTASPHASISLIRSIEPLAAETDAWLVDIWGVMHNGVTPYAEAVTACQNFRHQGGLVLLLSNSPRTMEGVQAQLDQIGVPRNAYDAIVTSGDATRHLIEAFGSKGIFHLGPERDLGLYGGLNVQLVDAESAEAVVCSGLFDDTSETPTDYAELLSGLAQRTLPMVCANPDVRVERGGRIIYCAGALANAYEELGGDVSYAGKPFAPIYSMAEERLAALKGHPIARDRLLAIGDGVKTDIAGAVAADIAAVYVASAVHMERGAVLDAAQLETLFPDPAARPIAAMTELRW